jgi:hypothetical protein
MSIINVRDGDFDRNLKLKMASPNGGLLMVKADTTSLNPIKN